MCLQWSSKNTMRAQFFVHVLCEDTEAMYACSLTVLHIHAVTHPLGSLHGYLSLIARA